MVGIEDREGDSKSKRGERGREGGRERGGGQRGGRKKKQK